MTFWDALMTVVFVVGVLVEVYVDFVAPRLKARQKPEDDAPCDECGSPGEDKDIKVRFKEDPK